MLFDSFDGPTECFSWIFPTSNHSDESSVSISPHQIPAELIHRIGDYFRAVVHLALTDEDVSISHPYEDVGLSCAVEGLTRRLSFKVAVQYNEQ